MMLLTVGDRVKIWQGKLRFDPMTGEMVTTESTNRTTEGQGQTNLEMEEETKIEPT